MRRIGTARLAGLLVLTVLVGANLILPAGAHVTRRVRHLFSHLDPRYINANEQAADANLLDGQDSTAFLGANEQAADANLLDGQNSSAFMAGPGKVVEGASVEPPFSDNPVFQEPGFFSFTYTCPQNLLNNGSVGFANLTGGTVDVFSDNGSTNPTYQQLGDGGGIIQPTTAAGEFILFQVHSPTRGIATIHVMSVHRASDCLFQVQAVISS